jgi:hypothetical protein
MPPIEPVALFPQEHWWLLAALSAFVGLCTYLMGGSKRPYLWNVAAFVSLIIRMESVPATENAFDIAVLRSLETGLGILCYTSVTLFLWPASTVDELDARFGRVERMLSGQAPERPPKPLDLPVSMGAVRALSHFQKAALALFGTQLRRLDSLWLRPILPRRRPNASRPTQPSFSPRPFLARAKAELGAPGDDNAQLRAAEAALETAKLNLKLTQVRASVDGYVTKLKLRLGSQAVANQPALALVDAASFWVHGYFRENDIADVRPNDRAIVTLMTYPDRPLEGRVDRIGWGISQSDGSTGYDLLPSVSPTFQWIRLAQRIPVRVHLDQVPEGVALRVGTTASVLVMTGTAGEETKPVPPVPRVLQ